MLTMKKQSAYILQPCLICGKTDTTFESKRPEGRLNDVWRVMCSCGQTSRQWSVSQGAAARAWNRTLAQEDSAQGYIR